MSEHTLQINQNQKEEGDKDMDSDVPDDENDEEGKFDNYETFNGSGRTVTLQMLLSANVLQPGKSTMSIEYLGQKFIGDLLPDGKIKSQETETIFLSPSAWAMYCKRIINPEKKSGCGWASVKYKGKKLDAYKANWMRKCAQQKDINQDYDENYVDVEKKIEQDTPIIKRALVPHNSVNNRNIIHDANTLVETVPFLSINKMQPFLVTISSNALLLAEFHSHITLQEVCGYFGGTWDVNTHSLVIIKTYPCKNTKYDREKAPERELQIQQQISKDQLIVVGWYHSHPKFQSQPTLRDCDTQLDYQIKMRGPSDLTYTPCIGFIFGPYYEEGEDLNSVNTAFWVVPPAENRQIMEYGRPMLMQYEILSDNTISDTVKEEMELCVSYYTKFRNELIDFSSLYREDIKFIDKLKYTLFSKFPQTKNDQDFWDWLSSILKCVDSDNILLTVKKMENKDLKNSVKKNLKVNDQQTENLDIDLKGTGPELKILSLQEQLCLPSGLNMNPSKLCPPLPINNISVTNHTVASSPSDSPITIPSCSASPAKFEIPIRASPSPAKSDTSSTRTRNSPAPSPGKFNVNDLSMRNSPCVTPNKFENNIMAAFNLRNSEIENSDLIVSNLIAPLSSQIASNALSNDLSMFLQKEYGNTSLKQLAETAAKVGSVNSINGNKELPDKSNNEYNLLMMNTNAAPKTNMSENFKPTPKLNQDSPKLSKSSSSNSSYKTKLMKELDDLKNDPLKISELMRSPEYAALLLQQAEALGATTLGSLGFGSDFPFIGNTNSVKNKNNLSDYTNMLHASKMLGFEQFSQQNKNQADINQMFQQHVNSTISSTSKKYQKQNKQADYTALLQTYSKYFDAENLYNQSKNGNNLGCHELSALLHSSIAGNLSNNKSSDANSEAINNLLQSDKNLSELNNLLFHQNKITPDLSSLFAPNNFTSPPSKNLTADSSSYYAQIKQEKIPEFASLYQQSHGKLGIPDPLSQSTLAANNMFMQPSALLKLHQESLMMKPPKTSPGMPKIRESHVNILPTTLSSHDRLTPTKTFKDNGLKYNFSAADLAVSSVPNSISQSSIQANNGSSKTPPENLSRLYSVEPPRKRMEFSSIADLVASPPVKAPKLTEKDDSLNLKLND